MNREEMQKIGHHDVYGDINYPKGIWFNFSELESFKFTGCCILLPAYDAVFDIFKSYEDADKTFNDLFTNGGPYSDRYAELWDMEDSKLTLKHKNNMGTKGGQVESQESTKEKREDSEETGNPEAGSEPSNGENKAE